MSTCPWYKNVESHYYAQRVGLNVVLSNRACKHEISRTTHWIYVIYGTKKAHGPQICQIDFDDNVMHINEWAGLNVKT